MCACELQTALHNFLTKHQKVTRLIFISSNFKQILIIHIITFWIVYQFKINYDNVKFLSTVSQKKKKKKKKKKKRNTPIYFNTNYCTEMKLIPIIMD